MKETTNHSRNYKIKSKNVQASMGSAPSLPLKPPLVFGTLSQLHPIYLHNKVGSLPIT